MKVGKLSVIELSVLNENEIETPMERKNKEDIELFSKHTIWITYRKGMPPLKHGKTSDSGWGCMIRSLQMVLAQTFITLLLGNRWKNDNNALENDINLFHIKTIINLFGDSFNNIFSIHNLVNKAELKGYNEGKWWGPTIASEIACDHLNSTRIFRTRGYVAKIGKIIGSEIEESVMEDGIFNPCIIFVPLRLGVDSPSIDFQHLIKKIFDIPQCMGMLGGKPSFAHYFHTFDGEYFYYLDPHTTQNCINMCNDWSINSYFYSKDLPSIEYKFIDPSVSLVFLIKNIDDYKNFMSSFESHSFSQLFSFKNEKEIIDSNDFIVIDDDDDPSKIIQDM